VIELTVKTTWQGKVAIRGQYLQDAIKTEQAILIYYNHGSMKIPNHEIYARLVAKSENVVWDKFGKFKPDYLYYFNWQPDVQQEVLV